MTKVHLLSVADQLPGAWRSVVAGRAAGANIKVLRMDGQAYPNETHDVDEALLVLEGQMNLEVHGERIAVQSGELLVVPAGTPHAVAPGSRGTLLIIDR